MEETDQFKAIQDWMADQGFKVCKVDIVNGTVLFNSDKWYNGKPLAPDDIEELYKKVNKIS
jgi:hypothetical protein